MARFTKGQTVYQVGVWGREVIVKGDRQHAPAEHHEVRIHERVVDACGTKQVTFFDVPTEDCRYTDLVLGRRHPATASYIAASVEQALAIGAGMIESMKKSDADRISRDPVWCANFALNTYVMNPKVFAVMEPAS